MLSTVLSVMGTVSGTAVLPPLPASGAIDTGLALRLRYETAESGAFPDQSEALTLRAAAFASWEPVSRVTLLGEVEAVAAIAGSYDNGEDAPEPRPVIADPGAITLNRLFAEFRPVDGASVKVGRQRIAHGEERFVGAIGFRQSDQTFDAARVEAAGPFGTTLDVAYLDAIKRPLGVRGTDDRLDGDGLLIKVEMPSPAGTVTGFRYDLDFADGAGIPRLQGGRSETLGVGIDGRRGEGSVSISWSGAYARQRDDVTDTTARYSKAQIAAHHRGGFLDVRYERLGDGAAPFSTPLGTNRAFQGHADVFLVTPPEGIEDFSIGFRTPPRDAVGLSRIAFGGRYHRFDPAGDGGRYGDEWDLILSARRAGFLMSVERAAYRADGFGVDLTRWWVTVARKF